MSSPAILLAAAAGAIISAPLTLAFVWPTIAATRRRERETQAELTRERALRRMADARLVVETRCLDAAMAQVASAATDRAHPADDRSLRGAVLALDDEHAAVA